MLKRLLWFSVLAAACWLVWRWLQARRDEYGQPHPQLAPSVMPLDHRAPPATARPSTPAPPREGEAPVSAPAPAWSTAAQPPAEVLSYAAYCNHCRTKRPVVGGREETTANGRRAVRGACAVCGKAVFAFLPQQRS